MAAEGGTGATYVETETRSTKVASARSQGNYQEYENMRAALLHNTGDEKLEIVDDIEVDAPEAGEVTIKIEATGVCHSDLHAMQGSLPQPAPFVPGHEGAGIISAVGDGVTGLAVGDH